MIQSLETEIVQPPFSLLFRQSGTRVPGGFPKSRGWALNLQYGFSDGVSTRDVSVYRSHSAYKADVLNEEPHGLRNRSVSIVT